MKVILKQDIKDLGKGGDLVEVKDGFARNYLIPQGLVAEATSKNVKNVEHVQKMISKRLATEAAESMAISERIAQVSITISKRVGENNRLFGSVTRKDIEEALREEGILINRKQIQIDDNIKELGVYDIGIRLPQNIDAHLKLWVVAK